MKEETIIALARMACGTAILISSLCLHVNGALQGISLFLIGVPIELLKREKAQNGNN